MADFLTFKKARLTKTCCEKSNVFKKSSQEYQWVKGKRGPPYTLRNEKSDEN